MEKGKRERGKRESIIWHIDPNIKQRTNAKVKTGRISSALLQIQIKEQSEKIWIK
jgi:hypothetical protein